MRKEKINTNKGQMLLNKIISLTVFVYFSILLSTTTQAQQDYLNSQYMFNLLNINPAYTGSRDVMAASLSHRSQWVGFEGAPSTQVLSIHAPITKLKIGVGLQIYNDVIGPRKMSGLKTSYAYHMKLGKGKIGFGLRAGIFNYSYDWSKLSYKDGTDEVIGQGKASGLKGDFDFGVYYKDRLQFAGLELAHLAQPTFSSTTTKMDLVPHASIFYGRAFELNDNIVIKGSVLARASQASAIIDMNASVFINKKIWAGLTYRTAGAVIILAEYYVTPKFRIGYSYDFYINGLANNQSGSHELFIGYDFKIFKTEMLSPRYF